MPIDTFYPHIAIIGRVCGDDEDTCLLYDGMTLGEAKAEFTADMLALDQCSGDDDLPEVYITHVLTSASPMEMT